MQLLAVCNQMCCNEVTYHDTYVGNKRTLFRIFFIDFFFKMENSGEKITDI